MKGGGGGGPIDSHWLPRVLPLCPTLPDPVAVEAAGGDAEVHEGAQFVADELVVGKRAEDDADPGYDARRGHNHARGLRSRRGF